MSTWNQGPPPPPPPPPSSTGPTGGSHTGWARRWMSRVQTGIQTKQESMRLAREAREAGQVWDKDEQTWKFYFLERELQQVEDELLQQQQQQQETTTSSSTEERQVTDREYYDLLQVSTNANATEIKRAYYKQAKQCHPDKNPNDVEAHAKFQALGHAYTILSNEKSRDLYDKQGKLDSDHSETTPDDMDPFVFFNVMFGSTLVEPYIGELWLASHTDSMMKDAGGMEHWEENNESVPEEERRKIMLEKMKQASTKGKLVQRKRQVQCALNLQTRIAGYDSTKECDFRRGAREEALRIVRGAYGSLYCVTIGFAWQAAAEEYLGFETGALGLAGHLARTKQNASGLASSVQLLGAGIKAASAGSKAMMKAEEMQTKAAAAAASDGGGVDGSNTTTPKKEELELDLDETKMAETLDESLPAFLEFAWAINKRDIQSTLRASCQKLFDDASVPKDRRIERACAVKILGQEFRAVGKRYQLEQRSKDFHASDIKARVAVATMTTMAKAQGQEVTTQDQEEMLQQAKTTMTTRTNEAGGDNHKKDNVDDATETSGGAAETTGA